MNKKYLSLWFLIILNLFGTVIAQDAKYYADPQIVKEFQSDKFTDEQRSLMINWLHEHGLLSQASMDGMIMALQHTSGLYPIIANVVRIFLQEAEKNNLPAKFGKGLSDGMIEGLGENLGNSEVMSDLTANINKAISQMGTDIGQNLDASLGKDSQLAQNTKETIEYYTSLVKGAYQSAVLESMVKTGVVLVGITAALYSIPFAIRTIERNMKRPKLIIESSQLTMMEQLKAFVYGQEEKAPMAKMVFNPLLKKYLDDIVKIVSMSHAKIKEGKTNIKYRNLMLYGPPGTGKTMFAKELARCSGLEFVSMSGSSFAKFQDGEAIEALDELFAWAQKCNGLMIFIDEAETFLSKRENMDPQSKAYQLLNNFLNYTGQRSSNFIIVFATNHKDVLDSAMYRRIDDLIEMPLPSKNQRIDALQLYINKILMDRKQNDTSLLRSVSQVLTPAVIEKIAHDTKGLSYGELEGIVNNIKTEADILTHPAVSIDLISTVVDRVVKKHHDFTGGKYLGLIHD